MPKTSPRVLFIGLDATSRQLILDWSEQGLLPNLRSLHQASSWGMTVNAPAIYTGSVWPSIWTGTSPGRHGCYFNEQLEPGTYETAEFHGLDVKKEPFWTALSRAGCRIGLLDVPKAPLSDELNGIHIVDWGTHDSDVPTCSWPPELIDEIHARYGASRFRRCDWVMQQPNGETRLREHLLDRIEVKVAMAEELLQRESWDLFMVGFGDGHCVGHQCWHVHDPSHPKHDPELRERLGDPVLDVYVALDRAVGRLVESAGARTTVLLLCSHGMAAHYDASFLLDEVLRRLEGCSAPFSRVFLDRARKFWKAFPPGLTERFATIARAVYRMPDARDRSRRTCFVVPTNANGPGIRLNLVGREPNGKLRPGAEADRFVAQLIANLHELTEPGSGRRLVKEVLRTVEVFPGEHSDLLPDLFVRWNRDKLIRGVSSPRIGTIIEVDSTTRRTGDHRPGGLFFLRGPGIPSGVPLPPARDEDFAPTMAALLDVDLPDVDGRSLLELRVRAARAENRETGRFPSHSS